MRLKFASVLLLALAACGPAASPGGAGAQTAAAPTQTGALGEGERIALLASLNLRADAAGLVENECGEKVTPQVRLVELGGAVGTAALLVMEGGPNTATCYGDGPGLTLLRRDGASWRAIYASRGGFLAVLPSQTGGVRDIAFAGPGFEHPLWVWNGSEYAPAGRSIADAQMAGATILP
jgi:hypothetical protein